MEDFKQRLDQNAGDFEHCSAGGADSVPELESTPELIPVPSLSLSEYNMYTDRTLYIDKTLILKDILDKYPDKGIFLFPRPRRFGKTLMMTTLKSFFEKPGTAVDLPASKDTSLLFRNRKIWACGEPYRAEQGKYPVIHLSFLDANASKWEGLYTKICGLLRAEVSRHPEILQSDKCLSDDVRFMQKLLAEELSSEEVQRTLKSLSRMLAMHYGVPAVLIIDEYDVPLQEGYLHRYYKKTVEFFRGLLTGGLKDNKHLKYGFLTGILRAAKAGIFSGLNNLEVFSVLNQKFTTYFGFTEEEVKQIARLYGKEDKYSELCAWYDGYLFGKSRIFNPWSVLSYFDNDCTPSAYWVDTSENTLLTKLLRKTPYNTMEELIQILNWEPGQDPVRKNLNISVIYPKLGSSDTDLFSFLLMTGYLKAENVENGPSHTYFCDLHIPNTEVRELFQDEIIGRFMKKSSRRDNQQSNLQSAMCAGDPSAFQDALVKLLLETTSSFDLVDENSYHMLLLGLCLNMHSQFIITSNRESGAGRYDIQLEPKRQGLPGILLELKVVKEEIKRVNQVLNNHAKKAIDQALTYHYDVELKKRGVNPILIYGVAFYKKNAAVLLH